MTTKRQNNIWKSEINDIIRGACGGFLFGIPLLYTMEVWWIGSRAKPQLMMIAIALMFIVVYLLNQTEGFRKRRYSWLAHQAAMDTVKAIAIGLACSTFILLLLRELTPETSLNESCCLLPAYWASRTTQIDFMNQIRFRYNSTRSSLSFNFSF